LQINTAILHGLVKIQQATNATIMLVKI